MKQLDPNDARFLYIDRPEFSQNFIWAFAFGGDGGALPDRDAITRWVVERAGLPALRERVVRVPLDLDHPYWVPDASTDPARHLHFHDACDWNTLREWMAELLPQPLDPALPLWELHVVDAVSDIPTLAGPATVVVLKMHHVTSDGLLSGQIVEALFAAQPVATGVGGPAATGVGEPGGVPSRPALLLRAVASAPRTLGNLIAGPRAARRAHARVDDERAAGGYPVPPTRRPRTRFNRRTGPRRCYDVNLFPRSELDEMKAHAGTVTANDLMLTVVSGAMRAYLAEHGDVVDGSLAAASPASVRGSAGVNPERRNQFVMMSVDLHTDIEDPVERLSAIHRSMLDERARMCNEAEVAADDTDLVLPGWLLRAIHARAVRAPQRESGTVSAANVFATSVPRRGADLVLCGARAVREFGMCPLGGQGGLAHSVIVTGDWYALNIVADPDLLVDAPRYSELLRASYADLRAALAEVATTR